MDQTPPHQTALQKAIDLCGTQVELSRRSQVGQQKISYHLNSSKSIPYHIARQISEAVDGQVPIDDFFKEITAENNAA
ncbi:YdaS family helix-turn-helix protein [Thalassospira tepidiphila]|uniref:HTH cro/C1-type domain-containing protein n=2 Tax=Thalassospira tepidiphila TaxID=393657 RepID=A0A853KV74_9PROT|nr:YdaS family helix-turn-helix protein [Thalassospira tepidiphila]NJB74594.1 hypothetical protein [Thalassospira tepidiphila]OAZ08074.1 hypothetical protein TH4_18660 [Thalassospira tepidiphila MCCC 1A03514]